MTAPEVRAVLFPTDFSPASEAAGRVAADVARHFGAHLHVLHVVPPAFNPETAAPVLAGVVAELGAPGATTATAVGLAAPQIVEYARQHGIDVIVMGTHGRTGVSHALLGSVAEAVLRRAPCPVLTVPAAAPAAGRVAPAGPAARQRCIVCARSSPDLICEHCRALIRGEVLEHKRADERAGHTAAR